MLHQSTHSSPHGTTHDLQNNRHNAELAVWPHLLTFEPFGVDLFDEVGIEVSYYELGLVMMSLNTGMLWLTPVGVGGGEREGRHMQG